MTASPAPASDGSARSPGVSPGESPQANALSDVGSDLDDVSDGVSDADLVRQCLAGHRDRFGVLYRRYRQRVRSTLYQLCGPHGLDDLEQETFLRAWKGLPKFRRAAEFSTWLYRIAWNVASDCRRDLARRRSRDRELARTEATATQPDWKQLHYGDLVQRGLDALPLEQRAVLVLRDLEDLPQKTVAEILEIPVGTVKSRLFQARATLRRVLEAEGVRP